MSNHHNMVDIRRNCRGWQTVTYCGNTVCDTTNMVEAEAIASFLRGVVSYGATEGLKLLIERAGDRK